MLIPGPTRMAVGAVLKVGQFSTNAIKGFGNSVLRVSGTMLLLFPPPIAPESASPKVILELVESNLP